MTNFAAHNRQIRHTRWCAYPEPFACRRFYLLFTEKNKVLIIQTNDSIIWLTSSDFPTFRFANTEYIGVSPDAEIRPDGDYWVCNLFDAEKLMHQSEENIWRNVLVSRKNQRVVCIDRYLRGGRTVGYCCVFQSERKEYPTYGTLHWDVSDSRNIEMVGVMLDDLKGLALKRHQMNNIELSSPASQDDYWK